MNAPALVAKGEEVGRRRQGRRGRLHRLLLRHPSALRGARRQGSLRHRAGPDAAARALGSRSAADAAPPGATRRPAIGWPHGRSSERTSYERVGAAAVLTITRPERRNAVDKLTADELLAGYRAFEADDEARVLVVTGEGGVAFCAGADLKALSEVGPNPPEEMVTGYIDRPEGPMGFTRLTASKPTIAAISGWCLAGGLEIALWCDLRIATDGLQARLPGAPLGRAADRRRHPAPAPHRRPRPRPRHDPDRPHHGSR